MSQFCDVALPVPLDQAFTYELGVLEVEVGARVVVPFAGQRLVGVVVGLHDVRPEDVAVKRVEQVMDEVALLSDELMELGKWIASYYCAPLGEVLRGMMPLTAEVKRGWRVEFCCGLRAVRTARRDFELLDGVARVLSVGAVDVQGRVEKLIEDKKAVAKELKTLRQQQDR